MSVELISVLVAVLAIGATLAGVILTGNRGLMGGSVGWNPSLESCANAWRSWKACWKGCARPSAGEPRPAKGRFA